MEGEMILLGGTTHWHFTQLPVNMDLVRLKTTLWHAVQTNTLLQTQIIRVLLQLVHDVLKESFGGCYIKALLFLVFKH